MASGRGDGTGRGAVRLELSVGDGVDTDRSRLAGRQMRGRRRLPLICRPTVPRLCWPPCPTSPVPGGATYPAADRDRRQDQAHQAPEQGFRAAWGRPQPDCSHNRDRLRTVPKMAKA